jgi:hypothetical protein
MTGGGTRPPSSMPRAVFERSPVLGVEAMLLVIPRYFSACTSIHTIRSDVHGTRVLSTPAALSCRGNSLKVSVVKRSKSLAR